MKYSKSDRRRARKMSVMVDKIMDLIKDNFRPPRTDMGEALMLKSMICASIELLWPNETSRNKAEMVNAAAEAIADVMIEIDRRQLERN